MLRVLLLALLLLASVAPAAAEYPERPLTIVVAYPAGGMVDIVARPMAESMKRKFPKGVAVLSRPGGGGSVGLAEVVQAKPDGYTIILAPNSTLVIHPQLKTCPTRRPTTTSPSWARSRSTRC
jgi:tripartite-type tricarboxylate transporter receptor subunit TctC